MLCKYKCKSFSFFLSTAAAFVQPQNDEACIPNCPELRNYESSMKEKNAENLSNKFANNKVVQSSEFGHKWLLNKILRFTYCISRGEF